MNAVAIDRHIGQRSLGHDEELVDGALEAVKRNLAKARRARVEKARERERRRALGISAKDFHADMARRRAAGLPFQPWLEWEAAREAELFGGGFGIE